jgi:hypothetical protein
MWFVGITKCVKNGVIILQLLSKENVFNVAKSKSFWGAIFLFPPIC